MRPLRLCPRRPPDLQRLGGTIVRGKARRVDAGDFANSQGQTHSASDGKYTLSLGPRPSLSVFFLPSFQRPKVNHEHSWSRLCPA